MNSVAVIMRHVAGNLISRWTDFLTTDGEKPTRHRDAEFEDWPGHRDSLLRHFHVGFQVWHTAIESLTSEDLTKTVTIRGEPHSVPLAIELRLRTLPTTSARSCSSRGSSIRASGIGYNRPRRQAAQPTNLGHAREPRRGWDATVPVKVVAFVATHVNKV